MEEVIIAGAARTPIGSFGGSLSSLSATRLGAIAVKAAVERAGISPEQVQELFMGNVLTAGEGQAPATQVATFSGLPLIPATTVNKVCASGMKAVMLAAQSIMTGENEVVVAGGMESMSNVPYYLDKARTGYRLGHQQVRDGILSDGLWDVYNDFHMGNAAELCAAECGISREEQDAYAIASYRRALNAQEKGLFKEEIVPVEISTKKGSLLISEDEEPGTVKFEKIPALSPVFQESGTVTAANASTINDGAAALVLMSARKARELGIRPLARIHSFADAQQAPEWFTTAPARALPLALHKAGMQAEVVDFYEINEAFSVVALANNREMKLNPERVNVNGGAVSLGHPIGCSGARILVTLLSVLKQREGKIGAAGICNGGGGASAIVIGRL
ncbi:acetyl-CoA C-acetyltransferase [Anseongella ginsenosidimutans]|uniref:acetyl-CoA C-acetyltransferase n=1 Tax=Anseongella ginsenosidimutans TaxID=496056 RepID=A0A4R3KT26_9SPHI|nr:acetyl-CoA C-acyltransferase [Anseongella ginsenosidimutans]QEC52989.1 acetyl-CoA C-acyltransferase [Anseongella ginsenosidimutans]TCS87393.1 acetyl-CoA C-acetyltransferase [Anseongella ginsenosidimutans]